MAQLIFTDGETKPVYPRKRTHFTEAEIRKLIGGNFDEVALSRFRSLFVRRFDSAEYAHRNHRATDCAIEYGVIKSGYYFYGPAIMMHVSERPLTLPKPSVNDDDFRVGDD